MMQYVTCDKFSLFAPKQGKKFQIFMKCKTLIHFYMKLRHKRTQRLQIILFHSIQQKWTMSKIVIDMATIGLFTWFT
jgi:hypothetical protein